MYLKREAVSASCDFPVRREISQGLIYCDETSFGPKYLGGSADPSMDTRLFLAIQNQSNLSTVDRSSDVQKNYPFNILSCCDDYEQ